MSKRALLPQHVNFPVCLAPMVGLSHVGLRLLIKHYLPQELKTFWPTEMLNSRRLPNENLATTPEAYRDRTETDIVPQILGNEEDPISKSLKKLEDWGAIGIDINMGCPVKKALKHNYGVALMGNAEYAAQVVEMTVRNTKLPISVKLRAGQKENPDFLVQFVKKIENAGAQWITLHPRFAHEMRRGIADWNKIRDIRNEISIPVIGNGDVQTVEDIEQLFQISGCDMVMIGRALTARPWLMWQYAEKLGYTLSLPHRSQAPQTPEEEGAEYGRALLLFTDIIENYFALDLGLRKIKFFVKTGSVWLEFGNTLFANISKAQTFDDVRQSCQAFFSQPQRMMKKTDLRI